MFIFLKHCWNFLKALFHFFLKLATLDSPVAPSLSCGTLVNCSRVALCGSSVWPVVSPCGHYLAFGAGSVSGLGYCPVSWRMSSSTPWGPSTRCQWYSPKVSQPKYLQIWPNVPLSGELLLGKSQPYSWVVPFQEPHPCPVTLCCGAQGHHQSPALLEVGPSTFQGAVA